MRKKHTEPLLPDTYYHVYNRGINGTRIFTKRGNADYFLEKYIKYITPIADTFAYVLMGNHFHFLLKTKSEAELLEYYFNSGRVSNSNSGRVRNSPRVSSSTNSGRAPSPPRVVEKTASKIISQQFSNLFNTYAQAINKQDKRTGGLFEDPFRRIPIDTEDYAAHLVYYIHTNPLKHGFTDDFTLYQHSSYRLFLNDEPTFIQRKTVFAWFGGKEPFLMYHGQKHDFDEKWYEKNWVEVE
jgi:putative transposase